MLDAHTMIEQGVKEIRRECGSDDDVQMELSFFAKGLACAAGDLLRQCGPGELASFLGLLAMAYEALPELAAVEAAAEAPVLMSANGRPTTLTPERIEAAELRFNRLDRGLTQLQVGQLVGVTNNVVSYWERNELSPTDAEREKLRIAFGGAAPAQLSLVGG